MKVDDAEPRGAAPALTLTPAFESGSQVGGARTPFLSGRGRWGAGQLQDASRHPAGLRAAAETKPAPPHLLPARGTIPSPRTENVPSPTATMVSLPCLSQGTLGKRARRKTMLCSDGPQHPGAHGTNDVRPSRGSRAKQEPRKRQLRPGRGAGSYWGDSGVGGRQNAYCVSSD